MIRQILRIATCGASSQNYLGSPMVPLALALCPPVWRRRLALEICAISPHYFVYQGDQRYAGLRHRQVLEAEFQRNLDSREIICQSLLKPHLGPEVEALDFGCGPGFLAAAAAAHCRKVTGVDVSRGALSCARVFHRAKNLDFRVVGGSGLSGIGDAALDLIFTFAVLQHVPDAALRGILAEFHRVLKPGGQAVCHIATGEASSIGNAGLVGRYALLVVVRPVETILDMVRGAGFEATATPIRELSQVNDDISNDCLFVLRKPAQKTHLDAVCRGPIYSRLPQREGRRRAGDYVDSFDGSRPSKDA